MAQGHKRLELTKSQQECLASWREFLHYLFLPFFLSQDRIVVRSDEITVVKEYFNLKRMVDRCQNMDMENSRWIRSGWKAFSTIKDELKTKLDKTLCTNLIIVLPAVLYASEVIQEQSKVKGVWSRSIESRNSTEPDTSQSLQTTAGLVQLSSGVWKTRKHHSENVLDVRKTKMSNDSGQHREK